MVGQYAQSPNYTMHFLYFALAIKANAYEIYIQRK